MITKGLKLWGRAMTLLLVSAPAVSAQMAAPPPPEVTSAAATISIADMKQHMEVIADDSMRGRDTPSPELMETAQYVADRFAEFGLAHGNGDSYLQLYPLSSIKAAPASDHRLVLDGPAVEFELAY